MMKSFLIILLTGLVFVFSACDQKEEEIKELKTQKEKASYTMGYDIGKNVSKGQYDIDLKTFMKGVEDGMAGKEAMLTSNERQTTMEMFEVERKKRVDARLKEQGEINKVEGEKFLAENKNKEGVFTFPSGVQMKIVEQGTGKKPGRGDIVVMHFIGRFLDGTIFDQSVKADNPFEMPLAQLLPGQQQVLLEMKEGGTVVAYIPPNMAFGSFGGGELIPPYTTLIYEMELLEVKPQK